LVDLIIASFERGDGIVDSREDSME